MTTYNAVAYTEGAEDPQYRLDQLPDRWALRIDLDYKDGGKVVMLYPEGQMPSEKEQQDLMWKLQTAAGRGNFTVTHIAADGTRTAVPALGKKDR